MDAQLCAEMSDAVERHDRQMCTVVGHAIASRARSKAYRLTEQHSLNCKLEVNTQELLVMQSHLHY